MARKVSEGFITHFATVVEFGENGQPKRATTYDSKDSAADNETAMKHSLALAKLDIPHKVEPEQASVVAGVGISLSESFELYFTWRSELYKNNRYGLSKEALRSRTASFQKLLLVVGDIDIAHVTSTHIWDTLSVIDNMPRLNQLPYSREKRLEVWIDAAKKRSIPDHDLVASKQAGEALKDYQSLFSKFLAKLKDHISVVPTRDVSVDVETLSYAALSRKQMAAVVGYWEVQPSSDYKWIILLAAYSGARRGDIFNLKISNVLFDTDCHRHYLFIEKGKTNAATRLIPVHNRLVELGFLDFLENTKPEDSKGLKVFRSFKTDHYITSKFRDSLDLLNIPKLTYNNRRYSFHSMRHSCITQSVKTNELHMVQRVVGHAISGSGITKKYIDDFELKDMLCVIDCLDW
ncbi:tyrosine-type recombinase/integrase [Shewanella livingstonensis]|nr:tyrosine-type recombinase/integrase [Shewanella livingstonensis]